MASIKGQSKDLRMGWNERDLHYRKKKNYQKDSGKGLKKEPGWASYWGKWSFDREGGLRRGVGHSWKSTRQQTVVEAEKKNVCNTDEDYNKQWFSRKCVHKRPLNSGYI